MRYFLKLAYNGKNYHGWQLQPNASSVQETLEKALSLLLKENIKILGAGRTDSGVHAKEMYAHFDSDVEINNSYFTAKLNSYLPKDIVIYNIKLVHNEAHARFDATSRTYNYHINLFKSPFSINQSWHHSQDLDVDKMNEASTLLLEYTDFECFSKIHTDVFTFNCKITQAKWIKNNHDLIFIITADRFLRNMVRAIVGTCINVGLQKIKPEDVRTIIESKDRTQAGFSVPAHGLYLTQITYPYLENSK